MAQKVIVQGPGLWTDTGTLGAPAGALAQADDVLLHRPQLIVPRPGFGIASDVAARSVSRAPFKVIDFDGDLVISSYDGTYRLERGSVNSVYTTTLGNPPDTDSSREVASAQARGSLYTTSDVGVIKLDDAAGTMERAGALTDFIGPVMFRALEPAGTTRASITGTNEADFVYCWVHKDANGYDRRSVPSNPYRTSTLQRSQLDKLYLPSGIVANDQFELYRTLGAASGTVPIQEYFLAKTHLVTSAEVAAGFLAFGSVIDDVPDAKLGASLYTNASQGGALTANFVPPLCADLCAWKGVMFAGDITDRPSLSFTIVYDHIGPTDGSAPIWDPSEDIASFTSRVFLTAVYTSGNPVVTGLSDVRALKVGQYCWSEGASTPESAATYTSANTTISSIRTKITLNLANQAVDDKIKIGDITFTWKVASTSNTEIALGVTSAGSASNLRDAINNYPWTDGTVASMGDANSTDWNLSATIATVVVTITDANGNGPHPILTQGAAGMTPAYELTMSANALANGAAKVLRCTDYLVINGVNFYHGVFSNIGTLTSWTTPWGETNSLLPSLRGLNDSAFGMEAGINGYAVGVDALARGGAGTFNTIILISTKAAGSSELLVPTVVLQRLQPSQTAITVQCPVRGRAFSPDLTTTLTSTSTHHPGRVAFSKQSEPEAWPLLNWFDVGDASQRVDRIIPLRDAILVFKRDGLFRITGVPSSTDSMTIDRLDGQFDSPLTLMHPECVCVLNGTCYAWTSRGIMAISENGVASDIPVSAPIGTLERAYRVAFQGKSTGGPYRGAFMATHERLGLVVWSPPVASPSSTSAGAQMLVYHTGTQCWSNWSRTERWATWIDRKQALYLSSGTAQWEIDAENVVLDETGVPAGSTRDASDLAYDLTVALTGVANVGLKATVSKAQFFLRTPAQGDILIDGSGTVARVISSKGIGTDFEITLDVALSGSTATWYQAIGSTLLWHAQVASSPGMESLWTETQWHLSTLCSSRAGIALLSSWVATSGASGHLGDLFTLNVTLRPRSTAVAAPGSTVVRIGNHRNAVRSPYFRPYFAHRVALTAWALGPVVLSVKPTKNERVVR